MRAINSDVMKQFNRRMVLDCIRRRPISRAELSDETQLTRASITQIIDSLMTEGLVVESTMVDSHRPGRRQTRLMLVKESVYYAGAYMNNSFCELGLMNLAGEVVWHERVEVSDQSDEDILDVMAQKLKAAANRFVPVKTRIFGLGICVPSPIERHSSEAIRRPGIAEQCKNAFVQKMKDRLGWNIYVCNVYNAYALDELYFGIGCKGIDSFMVFSVDENVGAGFVIRGNLFKGARGFSPEIGHITLVRDGKPCKCGNCGCLERYISIPAILENSRFTSWAQVVDCMDQDPEAAAIFNEEAEILAFEIVNLANVMDLDRAVLTGDLLYRGDVLADRISSIMDEKFVHRMEMPYVVVAGGRDFARVAGMPAYHAIFA